MHRLEMMIDSVSDAIVTIDSRGIIEYVNRGALELFGYSREELLGQNVSLLMPLVESGRHDKYIHAYLKTGQSRVMNHSRSVMGQRKDGSAVPLDLTLGQMMEHGEQKFTGIMRDVTVQHRLQQQAAEAEQRLQEAKDRADEANRAKSIFLATMSHEIRTPMNGVLGSLELLGLSDLSRDQRDTVVMAEQSGRELLRILDDILDFSKIEAGRLELRLERVSLREQVIDKVIATYAKLAGKKGLHLHSRIDASVAQQVCTDPLRLRQILHNFVSNALKFTLAGSVELSLDAIDGREPGRQTVRFSVRDTGIGISRSNQARLFKPFVQAEGDTTRRFGGTGLGLAICLGLADSMGGTITMHSEPGVGTTMSLLLPLQAYDDETMPSISAMNGVAEARNGANGAAAAATGIAGANNISAAANAVKAARVAPSIAAAEQEGTLVLVVDDHATNRNVLLRQLHALGYAAESASNGAEALEMLAAGRHALLISDCQMPVMDGYALTRAIRESEARAGREQYEQHGHRGHHEPRAQHEPDGDAALLPAQRHQRRQRLPIIACTANAFASDAARAIEAGMDDYIAKPSTIAALSALLQKHLAIPAVLSAVAVPLDEARLADITGGDAAVREEILLDYRETTVVDVAALRVALAAQEPAAIILAAHRICGASKMVGATGLAEASAAIERAVRNDAGAGLQAAHQRFDAELTAFNNYLEQGRV